MIARDALAALDALARVLQGATRLPLESQCAVLAASVDVPAGAEALPARDVVEAVRAALRNACAQGGLESIKPRLLRSAPLVMWNGPWQASNASGLLERFLREGQHRASWLRPLIDAWLRDFDPGNSSMVTTGRTMAQLLAKADDPRLAPWAKAHRAFDLFDAQSGPARLAEALLLAKLPLAEILRDAGMDDPIRAVGRFFRAAIRALLDALPSALHGARAHDAWERAQTVLKVERVTRDRHGRKLTEEALRFDELAGLTAFACLTPWITGPAPGLSPNPVKNFLVRTVGDPRLKPARWTAVDERATALMRRWLAEATLQLFFDLISKYSDDVQWRYRQKFWNACLRQRQDAEVWVVLDPALKDRAVGVETLRGSFGTMNGTGVRGQAVLLLRIGETVLCEWSNVGTVRAWNLRDGVCPKLYGEAYRGADLKADCLDFPDAPGGHRGLRHDSPASYLWQRRAAALLGQREGLWLQQRDYA